MQNISTASVSVEKEPKILLLAANNKDSLVIKTLLEKLKYQVNVMLMQSESQNISAEQHQMILMDLNIPNCNTVSLIKQIQLRYGKEFPIIVFASSIEKEQIGLLLRMNVLDYVEITSHRLSYLPIAIRRAISTSEKKQSEPAIVSPIDPSDDNQQEQENVLVTESNVISIADYTRSLRDRMKSGEYPLPTNNKVAEGIQKLLGTQKYSIEDLEKLILLDQSVASQIIKTANSAFCSRIGRASNVKSAIVRIGTLKVANIVQTICQRGFYLVGRSDFAPLMEAMWLHDIASAYIAKKISSSLGIGNPEDLYLANLFKNIGEPFLLRLISPLNETKENLLSIKELVKDNHSDFGALLLKAWKFDDLTINVCHYHQNFENQENYDYSGSQALFLKMLHLSRIASFLAEKNGYLKFFRDYMPSKIPSEITRSLNFLQIAEDRLLQFVEGVESYLDMLTK